MPSPPPAADTTAQPAGSKVKKNQLHRSVRLFEEQGNKAVEAAEEELDGIRVSAHREWNQQQLDEVWTLLIEETGSNQKSLAALISVLRPEVIDEDIRLRVGSDIQRAILETQKLGLSRIIYQLSGWRKDFRIEVDAAETAKIVYTAQQKVERLMDKNALVREFIVRFGLEAD